MQHGEHVLIYDHFIYSCVTPLIRKKYSMRARPNWPN